MTTTVTPLIPSWVYSLADYRAMFDLTYKDLKRKILDYPASVPSFNAEMYRAGHNNVVSADPHYDLGRLNLSKQVNHVIQQLATQFDRYVDRIQPSGEKILENILTVWNEYAQLFLTDYSQGRIEDHYQVAHLPHLPFSDFQFDLALCVDLLFRNAGASPQIAIAELCRVAYEVRVFRCWMNMVKYRRH